VRIAVIMSGGSGRRFWPLSREARPKQVVPLVGGKSLLELTIRRILPLFQPERIWIVTQDSQAEATA
jgi:mannose-1-phosphate guanylyltransferase